MKALLRRRLRRAAPRARARSARAARAARGHRTGTVRDEEEARRGLLLVAEAGCAEIPEPLGHASRREGVPPAEHARDEEHAAERAREEQRGDREEEPEERDPAALAVARRDLEVDAVRARPAREAREAAADDVDVGLHVDGVADIRGEEAVERIGHGPGRERREPGGDTREERGDRPEDQPDEGGIASRRRNRTVRRERPRSSATTMRTSWSAVPRTARRAPGPSSDSAGQEQEAEPGAAYPTA